MVVFLDHVISKYGIFVDPSETQVALKREKLKYVTEFRSFLGLAGYYRRFFEAVSSVASPLIRLTQKNV